jgi:ankyrin repeat protein
VVVNKPTSTLRALSIAALIACSAPGCDALSVLPSRTFHQRYGWKAEDYFSDPKVIALCKAIEANDLAEMDRLVKAGAEVNAQGKDKMTPLLWAFPDNRLPRFQWLLEHGANPNVIVESDFGTKGNISAGESVTHMACETHFAGYFDAVFDHGGDPNLRQTGASGRGATPLFSVILAGGRNRAEKVKRLIAAGADMNALSGGSTPPMKAAGWFKQNDLVLIMLEAGADFRKYDRKDRDRLIHRVVSQEFGTVGLKALTPQMQADRAAVIKWLEDRGESYEKAKADIARWDSWGRTSGEYDRKMAAEIAERKAREKAASEQKPE